MDTLISEDWRKRVDEQLRHFNEALTAAQAEKTPRNLEHLADAADRLMRAVGRVLIEAKRQVGD